MNNPITKQKLSEQVLSRLEEMLRSGRFPVGSYLPSERELMQMFSVGRPSIREALHALEIQGLIRIHSGERPRVTLPTPRTMLDRLSGAAHLLLDQAGGEAHFEQLRIFLEEGVARHAAQYATAYQRAVLRDALTSNEQTIPNALAFADTDIAFHRVLMEIPGNPIFTAVHQALVDWMVSERTPRADEAVNRQSYEGHLRVYLAIENGDVDGAAQAMRDHLEDGRRRFGPLLREDDATNHPPSI